MQALRASSSTCSRSATRLRSPADVCCVACRRARAVCTVCCLACSVCNLCSTSLVNERCPSGTHVLRWLARARLYTHLLALPVGAFWTFGSARSNGCCREYVNVRSRRGQLAVAVATACRSYAIHPRFACLSGVDEATFWGVCFFAQASRVR